ncbi:hypothetical protein BH24ACT15_BH24ACT15_37660 [soil metagenome]
MLADPSCSVVVIIHGGRSDELAGFGSRYRSSGRLNHCLDMLKDDLADPMADRICETLRVAREVGGTDLGRVLRTLSTLLREDARRAEHATGPPCHDSLRYGGQERMHSRDSPAPRPSVHRTGSGG